MWITMNKITIIYCWPEILYTQLQMEKKYLIFFLSNKASGKCVTEQKIKKNTKIINNINKCGLILQRHLNVFLIWKFSKCNIFDVVMHSFKNTSFPKNFWGLKSSLLSIAYNLYFPSLKKDSFNQWLLIIKKIILF